MWTESHMKARPRHPDGDVCSGLDPGVGMRRHQHAQSCRWMADSSLVFLSKISMGATKHGSAIVANLTPLCNWDNLFALCRARLSPTACLHSRGWGGA